MLNLKQSRRLDKLHNKKFQGIEIQMILKIKPWVSNSLQSKMMVHLQIEAKMKQKRYSVSKEVQDNWNFFKKSKKRLSNFNNLNFQPKISLLQGYKGLIKLLKKLSSQLHRQFSKKFINQFNEQIPTQIALDYLINMPNNKLLQ